MRSPRMLVWMLMAALLAVVPTLSASAQTQYGGSVVATSANCGLTQIYGQVFDSAGNPQNGVGLRLWWGLDNVVRTTSGNKPDVGPAGWDFSLNTQAVANTWYVATESNGTLTSAPLEVVTTSHCNQATSVNIVKVSFRQGASGGPAPTPPPGATPAPPPPPSGGVGSPILEAPAIAAGARCAFYTQTGNGRGGFSVCDDANASFLSTFNQYGLQNVGYPISRRYTRDGFITQAFQKAVFQWRPESRTVAFVNVFDELDAAGQNQTLFGVRQTPYPFAPGWDPPGLSFEEIKARRQALLNVRPAMRTSYFAVRDPLLFFGLPQSEVTDMGNHYAVRLQRGVLQEWKEDVPWARAGQVTVANGGDIAKELNQIYGNAIVPEASPPSGSTGAGPVPPAPTVPPQAPVPTPVPPAPPAPPSNEPPRNLDPELGSLGVGIVPANVASGQKYWRVTEVIFHNPDESQGRHAIMMDVLNEAGQRVVGQTIGITWRDGSATVPVEDKPYPEYGANYPMYKAGCSYNVFVNGYPSDSVTCLGLGYGDTRPWRTDHVEYLIKWQLVTKP